MALPAAAATSLSPTEVLADVDVTMTLRTTSDGLDVTTQVVAQLAPTWIPLACGAPDGWSCSMDGTQATWTRGTSIAEDDTFSLAVHTPADPGESVFTLTDTRASGATATNMATVVVLDPEPTPTETATAEPSEPEPTASPTTAAPAPSLTPFRPPANASDAPISIRDLPSDAEVNSSTVDPVAERVIPASPLTAQTVLTVIVLGLLTLSGLGFFVARANR